MLGCHVEPVSASDRGTKKRQCPQSSEARDTGKSRGHEAGSLVGVVTKREVSPGSTEATDEMPKADG